MNSSASPQGRSVTPDWHKRPYSWRCGYIAGGWKRTERDKVPPVNPIRADIPEHQQWNEGFEQRKREMENQ